MWFRTCTRLDEHLVNCLISSLFHRKGLRIWHTYDWLKISLFSRIIVRICLPWLGWSLQEELFLYGLQCKNICAIVSKAGGGGGGGSRTVTCTFQYHPLTGLIKPSLRYFQFCRQAFIRDSFFLYSTVYVLTWLLLIFINYLHSYFIRFLRTHLWCFVMSLLPV
jgi:hypothetical protein